MDEHSAPQDTWLIGDPGQGTATQAPAKPEKPEAKAKPKPKGKTAALPKAPAGDGAADDKAMAVSQDIAKAIDGITDQIHGIQSGLVRKVTHISVDAQAWTGAIGGVLRKVFSVPLTIILQIFLVPLKFVNGLLGKVAPADAAADGDEEDPVDWDAELGAGDAPEIKLADFNELLEKNIIFLDNTKRPIFSTQQAGIGGKFGKQVQDLYMEICLNAIRECAPLTNGMPPCEKGPYKGRVLEDLMGEVNAADVGRFFTFACRFAASYSGKNFRISETYATWLMNGAPIE